MLAIHRADQLETTCSTALPASPLWYAAFCGRVRIGRWLLDQGADVDRPQASQGCQKAPLMIACEMDELPMVNLLLERGADPTEMTREGNCLAIAIDASNTKIVKRLLQHPLIDVDAQCTYLGETPLIVACRTNQSNLVKLLLEHGANSTLPGQNGYAPWESCESDPTGKKCERLIEVGKSG